MKRVLISLSVLLMVSGCSILPRPSESVKKYTLDPIPAGASSGYTKEIQLVVETPILNTPLDNTRVAIKPAKQQLDAIADVEWADRLSALIQDSIIYSMENTGALKMVGRPSDGMAADHALRLEVRKFYIDRFTDPENGMATVEIRGDLISLPNRDVISSHSISRQVKCPIEGIDCWMESLNNAHGQATADLVAWVLRSLSHKRKSNLEF